MKIKLLASVLLAALVVGCGQKKDKELFNLPPQAWYEQIIKDIRNADLENAESHYVSFASEHVASDILPPTLLILAQAFVEDGDYAKANVYLDEYIRRYGTTATIEYAKFLKIKANFDSFSKPTRNQKLMQDNLILVQNFLIEYPNSQFRPLVETMLAKIKLAQYYLDGQIYDLYTRIGREDSAEVYKDRLEDWSIKPNEMIAPKLPWYMVPFE